MTLERLDIRGHGVLLKLATVTVLFSYGQPVAYFEAAAPAWVRVPDTDCTKTTRAQLVKFVPGEPIVTATRADFLSKLELVMRRAHL